jgi:hypothetical protein
MIYILLQCEAPQLSGATDAEIVGHVTGVLAQHGALGVHHTVRGPVNVSMLAGASAVSVEGTPGPAALDVMQALRGLAFDCNRTATPFGTAIGVDHAPDA